MHAEGFEYEANAHTIDPREQLHHRNDQTSHAFHTDTQRRHFRVLLAEDDEDTRVMIATALRQDGYEVIEARSGAELLDYVGASVLFADGSPPPDCIVSDIRMPGFTGTGVLAGLRDTGCDTPFVIITAFGSDESREGAHRIGADAVFHKPFDIDDLRTVVRNLLPRRSFPSGHRSTE